jgi:hypothetical protein
MRRIGLDYASVDGNHPPDFGLARKAGAEFVIIRKSFVLHDVARDVWRVAQDPCFARDADRARAAGLVVGAYGFFSFAKNAPSPEEQVSRLVAAPGLIRGRDLPYCVDVEFPGRGVVDTKRTQAEVFAFLLRIISEVRRQAGVSPMIYTSHGQWHDTNGLGGPDSTDLDGCPLWIKTPYRMVAGRSRDLVVPRAPHFGPAKGDVADLWRVPKPWERQGWWIQQTQGDAIGFLGFDATVDLSHFDDVSKTSVNDGLRVAWVQRRLAHLAAPSVGPLNADGKWQEDTTNALLAFQAEHHLNPHGNVDIATFASLCW